MLFSNSKQILNISVVINDVPALRAKDKVISYHVIEQVSRLKVLSTYYVSKVSINMNDPSKLLFDLYFEDLDNRLSSWDKLKTVGVYGTNPDIEIILGLIMMMLDSNRSVEYHNFIDENVLKIIKKYQHMINFNHVFEYDSNNPFSFTELMLSQNMVISFEYCLKNYNIDIFRSGLANTFYQKVSNKTPNIIEKHIMSKVKELYNELTNLGSYELFNRYKKLNEHELLHKENQELKTQLQELKTQLESTLENIQNIADDVKTDEVKVNDVGDDVGDDVKEFDIVESLSSEIVDELTKSS